MLQERPGSSLGAILGAKWEAKGAKMPPKNDLKIDEISRSFFDEFRSENGGKNKPKGLPKQ